MSVCLEILRCLLCCQDEDYHVNDYEISWRDPLLQSSSHSNNNNNLPCLFDRITSYFYECYPNSPASSSTTKKHSAVSQQSEYGNKSKNKTNEVSEKSPRPSSPSFSCNQVQSPSSLQSLPKLNPSSFPFPSSSKPYLSVSNSKTCTYNRSPSPPKAPQFLTQSASFSKSASASSKSFVPPAGPPPPSSSPCLASSRPAIPPPKVSLSVPKAPQASQPSAKAKPPPSLIKPSPSLCGLSQSPTTPVRLFPELLVSSNPTLPQHPSDTTNQQKKANYTVIQKGATPIYKIPEDIEYSNPTLSPLSCDSTNQQKKANYTLIQKGKMPIYKIPKDIENLIKKDNVPDILKKPLSPSTYKDYFAALLYAEDFYHEKWSNYQLKNVTLELHVAEIYDRSTEKKNLKKSHKKDDKFFVAFKIDSVRERRPFLLSRDFVYARRSGSESRKFQGFLYRVVKSTTVLVEFEKDFYTQHRPNCLYDISFSFNRVCLKRAHQAIEAASDPLFKNFLFPDCVSRKNIPPSALYLYSNYRLDSDSSSAVRQILSIEGQPPYLVEGPLSVEVLKNEYGDITEIVPSKTGIVVRQAVLQIYQHSLKSRILICAPMNRTCDVLMGDLMDDIPESDMFRANAAFREMDGVPDDILPLCLYEGECFSCPSLEDLREYRVVFSTFVSSFRLHNEGITAGHFTHIFLVDASSAIEPETIIPLSNLADENTTVIVTGSRYDYPSWVRSDIARLNGLRTSYFERLCESKSYQSSNPRFITQL
ncbi:P-loop containing nucleoside triphosphate hydrolase [Melia azedarach]|uniref:P-loop containing nucleoside triphosphate hydrolase n=1 Tax=Melia azedarach TaxID=155640 RepID=A0ACC1XGI4_MELAZ|nr:P-loop containing nucleoside triphosphate hydrolase [Melia azedarach]